jgi:hypothetical protein
VRQTNISCHGTFQNRATYLESLNETGADGAVRIEGVRGQSHFRFGGPGEAVPYKVPSVTWPLLTPRTHFRPSVRERNFFRRPNARRLEPFPDDHRERMEI